MDDHTSTVEEIADLARDHQFRIGVAESLTSGQLAADLGAGPEASSWFRGGLVAYASGVKFDVLGVTPGPVITASCAREMAHGAARLLDADAVVSTTGAGGPDPEEGEPPGTVFVAVVVRGHETCVRLDLEGDPEQVLRDARSSALRILRESMRDSVQDDLNGRQPPGTARDGGPAGSPSPATSR
jgi:nicotinamide-nucleotide amidase